MPPDLQAVTDNLGGQSLFGVELFVKAENVWFSGWRWSSMRMWTWRG